jgi:DNA invertase Pin-like site-specific DNA recombinase
LEAVLISTRTKAALRAAKARGRKLGGHLGSTLSGEATASGPAKLTRQARDRAADIAPTISEMRLVGITSLRSIAAGLNERVSQPLAVVANGLPCR